MLEILNISAVTISLPSIGQDFSIEPPYLRRLPPSRRLSDLFGRKMVFVVGMAWFTIWTLAPNSTAHHLSRSARTRRSYDRWRPDFIIPPKPSVWMTAQGGVGHCRFLRPARPSEVSSAASSQGRHISCNPSHHIRIYHLFHSLLLFLSYHPERRPFRDHRLTLFLLHHHPDLRHVKPWRSRSLPKRPDDCRRGRETVGRGRHWQRVPPQLCSH
ncbi:hypothetical protein BC936DRAFT_137397 [Jimgerdemannia flammicorona]|uniref:Uncharacterized protein n=1 Tax=Jimgerdemannia flammicorona TaxID=994334 RepID=A0A433CXG0_9FUNG|nr:hypothetical protein BC936DRAFT_137397 [Jimgerdemannia flammicorona]